MRQDAGKGRLALAEVDVQITVVEHVAKVGAHRHEDSIEPDLCGYIFKGSIVKIAVELERLHVRGEMHGAAHHLIGRIRSSW